MLCCLHVPFVASPVNFNMTLIKMVYLASGALYHILEVKQQNTVSQACKFYSLSSCSAVANNYSTIYGICLSSYESVLKRYTSHTAIRPQYQISIFQNKINFLSLGYLRLSLVLHVDIRMTYNIPDTIKAAF